MGLGSLRSLDVESAKEAERLREGAKARKIKEEIDENQHCPAEEEVQMKEMDDFSTVGERFAQQLKADFANVDYNPVEILVKERSQPMEEVNVLKSDQQSQPSYSKDPSDTEKDVMEADGRSFLVKEGSDLNDAFKVIKTQPSEKKGKEDNYFLKALSQFNPDVVKQKLENDLSKVKEALEEKTTKPQRTTGTILSSYL